MKKIDTGDFIIPKKRPTDRELSFIYGGNDLKYVVISNDKKPISPKQWNDLMILLEGNGYVWKGGEKPSNHKVPHVIDRYLWVTSKKVLSYGKTGYFMRDFFITLDNFKKII